MTNSEKKVDIVYRLVTASEWKTAQETGAVPFRDIDEQDGYVHLSTRSQLLETANLHFAGVEDLMALEIPVGPIAANLKFELAPKRGEAFPHLYTTLLASHVVRALPLISSEDGFQFGEVK